MPRKSRIRWGESEPEKLTKEAKKFNAKIYRTKKKHPELADIQPETIKSKDIKAKIAELKELPRAEYNKYVHSLERFQRKGSELPLKYTKDKSGTITPLPTTGGLVVTAYKKKETDIKVRTVNANRTRERKINESEKPSETTRTMGDQKHNELKPKKYDFDKIKKGKEWELFEKTIEKQSRADYTQKKMDDYKKNYLQAINDNLGEAGRELYNFIHTVPAEVLYKKYWEEDEVLRIQFTSDPLPADQIADASLSHWREDLGLEEGENYCDLETDNEINS